MLENDKIISTVITKISCIFSVPQILMHGHFAKIRNSVRVDPFRAFGIHLLLGHTCLVDLPLHTKMTGERYIHVCVGVTIVISVIPYNVVIGCTVQNGSLIRLMYHTLTVNDLNQLSHHVTYVVGYAKHTKRTPSLFNVHYGNVSCHICRLK